MLIGCVDGIRATAGSDPAQKKSIDLKGFTKIELNGSADMTVTVGKAESITVEGDQDRIDKLESKIVDGKLVFEEKSSGLFGNHGDLKITVTVPSLEAIELSGSGDVFINGVKGTAFTATLTGSGDIELKGTAETLSLSVTGSGDLNAKGLASKTSSAAVVGSGNIETSTSSDLTITITGSGDVRYFGDPKVTKAIAGSGDVNKG